MPTLRQLEAFYWTVQLGTFSAAAQKLNTSQSAITKRIQEVEDRFSIKLLNRAHRRSFLTTQGQEVFRIAESLLAKHELLLEQLEGRGAYMSVLRLGITEITAMTWLPALMRQIRLNYPQIDLLPSIDLAENLKLQLQEGQLDMIVSNQSTTDHNFSRIPLKTLELPWFASPEHFNLQKRYSVAEIASLPLIRQTPRSGLNSLYDEWLEPHIAPTNIFTINSLLAMAGMAAAGFGICCLPREYFAYLTQSGQLAEVKTEKPPALSTYYALFRQDVNSSLYANIAEIAAQVADFSNPFIELGTT